MMTKRILDFDFQLSRIFGEFIKQNDYDQLNNCSGLYDIVFCHRETAQDRFYEIKPHCHSKTKIVVDITTESGNLQIFLDSFNELTNKEPYQFYLIVDSDLSKYIDEVKINYKILHSFNLVFYAFLNDLSDNKLHNKKEIFANKQGFVCLNNSARIHRVWLFLEFLKRNISLDTSSFLFTTGGPNGSKYNEEVYKDIVESFYNESTISKDEYELLINYPLPKNLDYDLSNYSYIQNEINSSFEYIVNLSTENVMGLTFGDESPYGMITFTEKILKPFLAKQIPLFIALPGLHNVLRNLGFDLFDDLIDTDYESELNHNKRISKTVDELEKLMKIDLVKFKYENPKRFDYNFNLLYELTDLGRQQIKSFLYNEILN